MSDTPPPVITPLAGPTLPSSVASGELIESAWGNQVAASLAYVQGWIDQGWQTFTPTVSLGTTAIGSIGTFMIEPGNIMNCHIQFACNSGTPPAAQPLNVLIPSVPYGTDYAGYPTEVALGTGMLHIQTEAVDGFLIPFTVVGYKTGGYKAWGHFMDGSRVNGGDDFQPAPLANGDCGSMVLRYRYV